MAKKPKTVQVGSREYFESLLIYYTNRSTAVMRGRGNLSREDLEYVAQAAEKLKDKRLQECIAELIGWGDDERSELETLLALGFEAMKLCSPSRLREAAMRVSLKYYMKKEFSHAQESIERQESRDAGLPGAQATDSGFGSDLSLPSAFMPGSVPGPDHEGVQHPRGASMNAPNRWHVIPVGDLREHEPLPTCWCKPTPDEDHDVFVHHSLDGREAFETGERKPS